MHPLLGTRLHPWTHGEALAPERGSPQSPPSDTWGDAGQQICLRPRDPRKRPSIRLSLQETWHLLSPRVRNLGSPWRWHLPRTVAFSSRSNSRKRPSCSCSGSERKTPMTPSVLVGEGLWGDARNSRAHSPWGEPDMITQVVLEPTDN